MLIQRLTHKLKKLREEVNAGQDHKAKLLAKQMLGAALRNDLGGMENKRLYRECYWGTKIILENYIDEGIHLRSTFAHLARTHK